MATEQKVYPIYLTHLSQVLAVVIGGGAVGERKVAGLLAAGARVRLISPAVTAQLQNWATAGQIEWVVRTYQAGDLAEAFIAFATTNVRTVNAQVAEEAANLHLLCNVADAPDEGNVHVPAVHRQADLVIAVGSHGQNPRRSKQVRDWIAEWLATRLF